MKKCGFNSTFRFVYLCLLFLFDSVGANEAVSGKSVTAIFAGGCFWCMQPPFDALPGVIKTVSGFTGGFVENPSYKDVSNGKTGHFEAVEVTYDPAKISYEMLLNVFWHNIDPFDNKGQFCDKGDQYKAVIFYQNEQENQLAKLSKVEVQKKLSRNDVSTELKPAGKFYPAEESHQYYYRKNPLTYQFYRFTCGRDKRLGQVWGTVPAK